ncbi:unnamed protein product [Medioppia subpectinata]|uniref:Protein kinase domain-containing protein n=1 Tax=Medioppia subpectinata TaxID=1979941 RepID=A0A7R9KQQ9_9ACAR|nr:unnamed protein product [Medioppia subpectinata]CAG2108082.1 unnamed protein product [Medioppia subpectinata]
MSDKNEWEGRAQHTGAGPPTPSSPGQWRQPPHTPGTGVRQSTSSSWLPPTPITPAPPQSQIQSSGWYQVNTGALDRYPASAARRLFTDTRPQMASTSEAQLLLPGAVPTVTPVTQVPGPGYPERTGNTPTGYIMRPMGRLQQMYEEVPAYGHPQVSTQSGDMNVSSARETGGGGWLSRLLPCTPDSWLNDKTVRDLAKLRSLGFDVQKFERGDQLGEGAYSRVFMGAYTGQIGSTAATRSRYLAGVKPGQTFAAKYVQLTHDTQPIDHLCHIVEKGIIKTLKHPNIVAFKVNINLGQRVILRPLVSGQQLPDIVSYRRMFLIMEYGDQGSLDAFTNQGKLNDQLTVQFTGELCSAMAYMHYNGVAHLDCHINNIMVFSAPGGQFTVKYIDFGLSLSCPLYSKLGVQVWGSEWRKMAKMDMSDLVHVLHYMLDKCRRNRLNTGADLSQVRAVAREMLTTKEHMFDVIKKYTF